MSSKPITAARRASNAASMRRARQRDPEKHRQQHAAFVARNADRLRAGRNARYAAKKASIVAQRRGTTLAVLEALHLIQQGRCAICEKDLAPWPSRATHVDHCHDTGAVRGLLCRSCNMKEGWVKKHGARLFAYLSNPPGVIAAAIGELV